MEKLTVSKNSIPWPIAGLLLGCVQILAFYMVKPLGVSTEFVVVDSIIINKVAPEYAKTNSITCSDKYTKCGYGTWLDVGLIAGAGLASVLTGRWRFRSRPVWWKTNYGNSLFGRFVVSFIGGFLILLGARLAHGCTSGQFASGWAQLSLSALPFTVTLFGFGMLTAFIFYRKSPEIEK